VLVEEEHVWLKKRSKMMVSKILTSLCLNKVILDVILFTMFTLRCKMMLDILCCYCM